MGDTHQQYARILYVIVRYAGYHPDGTVGLELSVQVVVAVAARHVCEHVPAVPRAPHVAYLFAFPT
jgi:hypothetical protein